MPPAERQVRMIVSLAASNRIQAEWMRANVWKEQAATHNERMHKTSRNLTEAMVRPAAVRAQEAAHSTPGGCMQRSCYSRWPPSRVGQAAACKVCIQAASSRMSHGARPSPAAAAVKKPSGLKETKVRQKLGRTGTNSRVPVPSRPPGYWYVTLGDMQGQRRWKGSGRSVPAGRKSSR